MVDYSLAMQPLSAEKINILADLSERTIYLMGGSFVLGSLVTVFLLVMLEFVRRLERERNGDVDE